MVTNKTFHKVTIAILLILLFISKLNAIGLGETVNEPGVVIYKETEYPHRINYFKFDCYINRIQKRGFEKGYISVTGGNDTIQIFITDIIYIILDRQYNPKNLETDWQIEQYMKLREEIISIEKKFPQTEAYLKGIIALIDSNINSYHNGNVLRGGDWKVKKEVLDMEEKEKEYADIERCAKCINQEIANLRTQDDVLKEDQKINVFKERNVEYDSNSDILITKTFELEESLRRKKEEIYKANQMEKARLCLIKSEEVKANKLKEQHEKEQEIQKQKEQLKFQEEQRIKANKQKIEALGL